MLHYNQKKKGDKKMKTITISDLIKALEEIKKEHGDIEVHSVDYNDNGYVEGVYDYYKCDILESVYKEGEYDMALGYTPSKTMLIL